MLKADAGQAILLGGDPWRGAMELHRPGTFGLDRSPGWTVSIHWRACIQQVTAGPGAACVLAAARAGIGVPGRTKAPAGRDGRAWLS